ncbi:hypothetical protein [Permianibacter aggregans]|uniref:Beta-barrel assembly machine subunit BamE n=1 Tax=Permianibacter aggregans TaxID=1510150 RepID=A0A4R6U4C8_9GAMM|nr:hypothetical protein [Permianibacter aggregans]QGX39979.1 hypothetical protein E2H98_10025 [Permianibacter aggregans]TDQ41320.1 hypothetical protein EV696_1412 [Permianibacter aggregans]
MRKLALSIFILSLAACSKLTEDNYKQIEIGMDREEVESILGAPDECGGALSFEACTWGDDNRHITVGYAGDKVLSKSKKGL